jgi:purine nucleosidase
LRLVVDTDTGIDDTLALLWLASREEVEMVAVHATHGNCGTGQAAANARHVLDVADRPDVPVIAGRSAHLTGARRPAGGVHGSDGLGDCGVAPPPWPPATPGDDAVADLLRLADAQAGELDLLALGPLTNLGAALAVEPGLLSAFRSLTIMGGTGPGGGPGVSAPQPPTDANTAHDPEAARLVAGAIGTDVTLVGLDVTLTTDAGPEHLARLAAATTAHGRLAATVTRPYLDAIESRRGVRRLTMHDPIAAMVCAGAEVGATFVTGRAVVEGPPGDERTVLADATSGAGRAAVRGASGGRAARALAGADATAVADALVDALVRPLPPRPA